jgi:hypothetical protein
MNLNLSQAIAPMQNDDMMTGKFWFHQNYKTVSFVADNKLERWSLPHFFRTTIMLAVRLGTYPNGVHHSKAWSLPYSQALN